MSGIFGAGTAGPREVAGDRGDSFLRLGRAVLLASCAAAELELPAAIAKAPAADGSGGVPEKEFAGVAMGGPPRFYDKLCRIESMPAPLLCICLTALPRVMPRLWRYDS